MRAVSEIRFEPVPAPAATDLWPALVLPAREIEREAERLAGLPRPADGRRRSLIVHPCATEPGLGLAPGIQVALEVLLPGERTAPIRHNSTQLGFCIRGGGAVVIGAERIEFARYDVWNHPAWRTYHYENATREPHVRLTYSNAALLEKLRVHVVDASPPAADERAHAASAEPRRGAQLESFPLGEHGAWLMPYEILIDPPAVESNPLHWPWAQVREHLMKLEALGRQYVGRRLYLLYNPITGRTNGTTPGFFATMTIRPPGIVDRPHRHTSAAINYYFHGRGWSTVEGRRIEWGPGDLMFSAPGWAVHHHASGDGDHVHELTVQDQPFHIGQESLLWQESLSEPPAVLGAQPGFRTNRER
jgi:gentisate 1,2-dioxygenase